MIEIITNVAIETGGQLRTHHYGDEYEVVDENTILKRIENIEVLKTRLVNKTRLAVRHVINIYPDMFSDSGGEIKVEEEEEYLEEYIDEEDYYELEPILVDYYSFTSSQILSINNY